MLRFAGVFGATFLLLLATLAAPLLAGAAGAKTSPTPQAPPVAQVLQTGVLIVISKASQQMFVFKNGAFWGSSPVSTGKPGHSTPAGTFPILQKRRFHRSNLYSNAPMPWMQRLTWGGVAIHAGDLPGYPASHGCIRLPADFAKALYALTDPKQTTVVITNTALDSAEAAKALAIGLEAPPVPQVPVPAAPPPAPPATLAPRIEAQPLIPLIGPQQTIQLAAAETPAEAEAQWSRLLSRHPELGYYHKSVIPAVVGSRRFYRLRASAPDAHAFCHRLRSGGEACFNVR